MMKVSPDSFPIAKCLDGGHNSGHRGALAILDVRPWVLKGNGINFSRQNNQN